MLIDCGLTDTKDAGYLLEGNAIAEMLYDDVAANGRFQQVYTYI